MVQIRLYQCTIPKLRNSFKKMAGDRIQIVTCPVTVVFFKNFKGTYQRLNLFNINSPNTVSLYIRSSWTIRSLSISFFIWGRIEVAVTSSSSLISSIFFEPLSSSIRRFFLLSERKTRSISEDSISPYFLQYGFLRYAASPYCRQAVSMAVPFQIQNFSDSFGGECKFSLLKNQERRPLRMLSLFPSGFVSNREGQGTLCWCLIFIELSGSPKSFIESRMSSSPTFLGIFHCGPVMFEFFSPAGVNTRKILIRVFH